MREHGTRYIWTFVRTVVDPTTVKVSQNNPGRFEVPKWDQASRKKVHDELLVLVETLLVTHSDTMRMWGNKDQVDPVRRLMATAIAVAGLPEKDALYLGPRWTRTTVRQSTGSM
jgi:hypothetical protein